MVADDLPLLNVRVFDLRQENSSINIDTGNGSLGVIANELGALRAVSGLGGYAISSQFGATQAVDALAAQRAELANIQGVIGAGLSRLDSAFRVLGQRRIELDAARSQIEDVDVAQEAAELTRATILQQAGAAVLAQANEQTSLALLLLNGE